MTDARQIGEEQGGAAARAYRIVEHAIVTLELAPGSSTTERELIERTRLGRTPTREAIQRLAWEGLLEVRPRAGLLIAPLRASDWPLVIAARRGVEVVLAQSAARLMQMEARAGLRDIAAAMQDTAETGDAAAFLDLDKRLDDMLADATDNAYAARVAAPLQAHSRRFWFRFRNPDALALSATHHGDLVEAIASADMQRAGREAGRLMDALMDLATSVARG